MIMRYLPLQMFVLLAFLSGCAERGSLGLMDNSFALSTNLPSATQHRIFVATSRERTAEGLDYTGNRSTNLSYARFTMSVPPLHAPGEIEWPKGKTSDPAKHFVVATAADLGDAPRMRSAINDRIARLPPANHEAVVFIHGYNTNFAEGLYRFAQMVHDFKFPGVPIHYSWPSAGSAGAYIYDRDSTAIARDGLERFLTELAKTDVQRIVVMGHSMGGFLTVEALRQMAIKGNPQFRKKLQGVVLMSPDIDLDVFRAQVGRMQPLPDPFVIFASKQDKALRISARLTGKKERLGSAIRPEEFKRLGITLINVSDFKGGDSLKHMTAATSPAVISILRSVTATFRGRKLSGEETVDLGALWASNRSTLTRERQ